MRNYHAGKFIVVVAFLLSPVDIVLARQADSTAEVLTLEQAVANATANAHSLKITALETQKIEDRIAATLTKRRPSSSVSFLGVQTLTDLTFTYEAGQFGQFPSTGPIPPQKTEVGSSPRLMGFAMVKVDQPLTQLSRINLAAEAQRQELEANRETVRLQRQKLTQQIRQLYYEILRQESSLESSDETLRQYTELDRMMTASLNQQVVLRSDSLEVKSLIAQEEYNKIHIRNTIDEEKENLNRLMGRDIRTAFRTQHIPDLDSEQLDLAAAQTRALAQRPEIRQAGIQIKQAEYDQRLKNAEKKPDFGLAFRYLSPVHAETLPKNIVAVGFSFSWEPWDWGRKDAELSEKQHTVDQAKESRAEVQSQILAEVSQAHRKLEEARAMFRVIEVEREAVREKARLTQEEYSAKTVLLKDVLNADVSLAGVNMRYQQALVAYWTARADFDKSMGMEQ